ncbi:hypothetical protein V144x_38670 [Gimesia aquarii]|uniref:Uncharacterized protein n=1 Tax=Gimesia aquarii TaxID=2527964 RepID=A0A517VZF0_9PLAN|nr:hypothetical protein V144x_38670 [Gimesia aquarii]
MKCSKPKFASLVRDSLLNQKCWYVSSGAVGTTFELALGKKILRCQRLLNLSHPQEFREYEGSANLLVWCAWRLDRGMKTVTSWDDEIETVVEGLSHLTGKRVIDLDIQTPAWDLLLKFTGDYSLKVFCDHVPGNPSCQDNWILSIPQKTLYAGPGQYYGIERKN